MPPYSIYKLRFYLFSKVIFLSITFLSITVIHAQQLNDISESFEDYNSTAEEVIYLHLNKSTYIKGESIGFAAYVLDKHEKLPALMTTNLYVSIEDEEQNPVAQKLIQVNKGIAHNSFMIDEDFKSGTYLVKAYTNWSRNFDNHNYFVSKINIVDPETDKVLSYEKISDELDVQFLPESGHLVADIVNKVGVAIKDEKGFGVPNVSGEVFDSKGNVVSSFKANDLGLGSFVLLPQKGEPYLVKLEYRLKNYEYPLNLKIEPVGVALSASKKNDQLVVSIKTNSQGLEVLRGKPFYLSVHNGDDIDVFPFSFQASTSINQTIDLNNLSPGINVLTLFNDRQQPLAERLIFNHLGLPVSEVILKSTSGVSDSLKINLQIPQFNPADFNAISVSVLPEQTDSYKHHYNLISKVYLEPYISGSVEQASYYFSDVTPKKHYDLDLLLLTQGWSSYNWNEVFNPNFNLPYEFERGIDLKANVNNVQTKKPSFLLHSMNGGEPVIVDLENDSKSFELESLFLNQDDSLYISEIVSKKKIVPAQLFLQSSPSGIPRINTSFKVLEPKPSYGITTNLKDNTMYSEILSGVQQLEEIVLTTELDKVRARTQELSKRRFGRVKVVSQTDRYAYLNIEQFLQSLGLVVQSTPDGMIINRPGRGVYRSPARAGAQRMVTGMAIFFNDVQLFDTSYLYNLPLNEIDYVEVNTTGMGMGFRSPDGYVKIYTLSTTAWSNVERETVRAFGVSLIFDEPQSFYIPKYQYRNDDFYKNYGTVAWEPNLKIDDNGEVHLSIEQPLVPLKLFVEGMSADGTLISEVLEISIN